MGTAYLHLLILVSIFMATSYLFQRRSAFHTWRNFGKTWLCFGGCAVITVGGYFAICGASCFNASAGIQAIGIGSSAERAGLQVGDRFFANNQISSWDILLASSLASKNSDLEFSVMRDSGGELREVEIKMERLVNEFTLDAYGIELPIEFHSLTARDVALATWNEFKGGLPLLSWTGMVSDELRTSAIVDRQSKVALFVRNTAHGCALLLFGSILGMVVVSVLQRLMPRWFINDRAVRSTDRAEGEIAVSAVVPNSPLSVGYRMPLANELFVGRGAKTPL
jgi:hypothetical protein